MWMTNEKEQIICKAVVDAINDGTIGGRIRSFESASDDDERVWADNRSSPALLYLAQTLKITAHGKAITLGMVRGGGTCGNCDVEDINAPLKLQHTQLTIQRNAFAGPGGGRVITFFLLRASRLSSPEILVVALRMQNLQVGWHLMGLSAPCAI